MDIDTVREMQKMSAKEVDLDSLKIQNEEDKIEPAQCKLFKVSGYKTYNGMSNTYDVFDGQKEIEQQINDFLKTFNSWYLESVNVQVVKNFYPHTQNGEYEEIWYGTVVYHAR